MGMNLNDIKEKAGTLYHQVINTSAPVSPKEQLMQSIHEAKRDLECAEARFNEVTDKDLIDNAIYEMMSAKTRYAYLLRSARSLK